MSEMHLKSDTAKSNRSLLLLETWMESTAQVNTEWFPCSLYLYVEVAPGLDLWLVYAANLRGLYVCVYVGQ